MFTNGKFSSALVPLVVVAILVVTQGPSAFAQAGSPAPAMNPIQIENAKPGTPGWELENPAMGRQIEGYASLASVNRGEKIDFFVSTKDPNFKAEIFRMGWYGGVGARQMPGPSRALKGLKQATPKPDADGYAECDWQKSFSLQIPDSDPNEWISGHYLVRLTSKSGKQSWIPFVVRDDARVADIGVNSSVTTWQAYNNWPGDTHGGKSTYGYNSSKEKAAFKVSFNRPYGRPFSDEAAAGVGAGEYLTNVQPFEETAGKVSGWEYTFTRFIEREGQDVKYFTDLDLHQNPLLLRSVRLAFLVGHDEYYSQQMRASLEKFYHDGGHVGVLSSNSMYWQIRLEPSKLGQQEARTLVAYKGDKADPLGTTSLATTNWRGKPVNNPEQNFLGLQYKEDPAHGTKESKGVKLQIDKQHWIMRGTNVKKGHVLDGAIGYEADRVIGQTSPDVEIIGHARYYNENRKGHGTSHMTLKYGETGGVIFGVGGMNFNNLLDPYWISVHKTEQDGVAQQMVRNFMALSRAADIDFIRKSRTSKVTAPFGLRCEELFKP